MRPALYMTTPDHHPYLADGDLRTAEDVLEWLARPRCCTTLGGHIARLRARLDRERRQACRRGALEMWAVFRSCVFHARDSGNAEFWGVAYNYLQRALAFRAAARAR